MRVRRRETEREGWGRERGWKMERTAEGEKEKEEGRRKKRKNVKEDEKMEEKGLLGRERYDREVPQVPAGATPRHLATCADRT